MSTWNDWQAMLQRASVLEASELQAHARVSLDNKHQCQECFTCACAKVYLDRVREEFGKWLGGKPLN